MALETDKRTEIELRKNKSIRTELFVLELNNGETLRIARSTQNVVWAGDEYIAFPVRRGNASQNEGQTVNQITMDLGDKNFAFSRLILNAPSIITKAAVIIYQQVENTEGIGIIFRQIFKGVIVNASGQDGVINFTIVEPYYDFSKPINRRKFGDISDDVSTVNERLF